MSRTETFRLGDVSVTRVLEMERPFFAPSALFPDAPAEAFEAERHWLEPDALCPESGRLILAVQSYLLRSRRHTILIDSCVGCDKSNAFFPDWHRRQDRSWLASLAAAGVRPEEVDFVLCTHLHSDHCGWNTQLVDGRWVPTFPNARYVLARQEVAPFEATPNDAYNESVLPVIEAGQADLVEMDHTLDDEVWLEPTGGHTPGHVAVRLASGGAEAVMRGDVVHSPIQCLYPDWAFSSDHDPDRARATRRAFLEASCADQHLVLTAHFPSPSVGHVLADGAAFRFHYRSL